MFENVRSDISKKFLDWAEILPKFNGGSIKLLQEIREHQRKEALDAQESTKIPDDIKIEFLGFRMVELFQSEDYEQLERSLISFFPDFKNPLNRNESSRIREFVESGLEDGWHLVGIISKRRGLRAWDIHRTDPKLSDEISDIEIRLYKILPSIIALVFDVKTTGVATENLRKIQSQYYLSKVKFFYPFPFILKRYQSSTVMAETVKSRRVLTWLSDLRISAQQSVKPLLSDYFTNLGVKWTQMSRQERDENKKQIEQTKTKGTNRKTKNTNKSCKPAILTLCQLSNY